MSLQPYYEDDAVTLYHGDCLDVLPTLSDVGLVLTSPPYNLNGDGYKSHGNDFKRLDTGYDVHTDDLPHAEYVEWQQTVLRACWGALSDTGAIFYNHKPIVRHNRVRLPLDLLPEGMPLRQIVTWDRTGGVMRVSNYFCPTYEWVLILAKDAFRLATLSVNDVWRLAPESGSEHPASFPLSLASTAVNATSAGLVVDPFAGSGTTLRAAKDAGRRAIGIEKSERYCEIAARRMGQEVLDLGGVA